MFKNRSIEMKVVKNPKQESTPRSHGLSPNQIRDLEHYNNMLKDNVKNVAMLAGAGYTLKRVLDVASEIAIITAKAKIK